MSVAGAGAGGRPVTFVTLAEWPSPLPSGDGPRPFHLPKLCPPSFNPEPGPRGLSGTQLLSLDGNPSVGSPLWGEKSWVGVWSHETGARTTMPPRAGSPGVLPEEAKSV